MRDIGQLKNNMSKADYNNGNKVEEDVPEEVIGGTSEGETILCGIESGKKSISKPAVLTPIDTDWKMEMIEEIGEYLVSPKIKDLYEKGDMGAFAGLKAIEIINIVESHLRKNGYELTK